MKLKNTKCQVKVQRVLSEEFPVSSGITQGDTKASTLFNKYMEKTGLSEPTKVEQYSSTLLNT